MRRIEAPVLANQVLAATSAVFSWATKEEILTVNPCRGVDRNATMSRERVLSDSEVPKFWLAFDAAGREGMALKAILLTGQRPGEVTHMRHEHIKDGWWALPGAPDPRIDWPGTKNGRTHRVWLAEPVRALIGDGTGFAFAPTKLDGTMRDICKQLNVERTTPHDLRRTFSSTVTGRKFGRDAMNRVTNHKEGGIADVYDRHSYEVENRHVMEAVAAHIMALAEGRPTDNVVDFRKPG
jgi:integrase